EISLACRDVEQPGPAKAGIDAKLLVEVAPQFEALHRQRKLAQIAVLLAAPAPIAAGLLTGDAPLLQKGNRHSFLCQSVGGGSAGHAAADHHHVCGTWQLFITHNRLHRGRHDPFPCWTISGSEASAIRSLPRPRRLSPPLPRGSASPRRYARSWSALASRRPH